MFWWLWSTRRKVTVLLVVLGFPLSFLGVRAFGSVFSGGDGTASPTSAPSVTAAPAPEGSTTVPGKVPEVAPVASTPLQWRPTADLRPPAKLASFAWLTGGAVPLPSGVGLVLPGGENGFSFWGLHREAPSFREIVDAYADRYGNTMKVEREESTAGLERLRLSGKIEDEPFTASVRFLDLGGGEVSIAGLVLPAAP
jgi:hypothetical protein